MRYLFLLIIISQTFSQLNVIESINPIESIKTARILELNLFTSNYGNGFLNFNPSLLNNNKDNILKSFNIIYGKPRDIALDSKFNYPSSKIYLPTDSYIDVTAEYYSSRISNVFIGLVLDELFDN